MKLLYTWVCDNWTLQFAIRCFTGFDQQTYGFFKGQLTPWSSGFTKNAVCTYKSLHFPGKIEDLPNWYVSIPIIEIFV